MRPYQAKKLARAVKTYVESVHKDASSVVMRIGKENLEIKLPGSGKKDGSVERPAITVDFGYNADDFMPRMHLRALGYEFTRFAFEIIEFLFDGLTESGCDSQKQAILEMAKEEIFKIFQDL
jgi:hypothetical protein